MSIRVLLRDHPNRAIALATESHALIFRHSPTASDSLQSIRGGVPTSSTNLSDSPVPRCVVEFLKISSVDLTEFRTLTPRPVHGTLGLITIERDVFLCLITGASRVAQVRPGETVERIYGVEFYCLSSSRWDSFVVDALQNIDPYEIQPRGSDDYSYRDITRQTEDALAHPCAELNKMLSNGSFYYSTDFDLTNRLQDRSAEATDFDIDNLDDSFLWNSYMINPLVNFRKQLMDHERAELDKSRILTSVIRGFVLTITIPIASDPIRSRASPYTSGGMPSTLTLISRLSCRRAGTRFNSRGIDDDGNVANFVESEALYYSPLGICFSYAQVRGSVPIFWEQQAGLLPGKQNISLTRGKEGTQPAFDKHFVELEKSYGSVHVVNLLSEHKPGEVDISNRYRWGVQHCSINNRDQRGMGSRDGRGHELLRETSFDFHAETKGPGGFEAASIISQLIEQDADVFAYYLSEELDDVPDDELGAEKTHSMPQKRSVVVLQQDGVFRTNCLDCLDRTNLIQTIISKMALETFLSHRGQIATQDFWMRHSSLWADNGDALSRIYAGTGALKTSFTRHGKMSIAGAIADARKSATRLYINNFADKGRQNTIDLLLGRVLGQQPVYLYDPINDYVTQEMARRLPEYSSKETINIFVGTFNVNGRIQGVETDLRPWLFPNGDQGTEESMPVMYVIGFQEIVNLSPQQIMNSDPTRKKEWEHVIRKHLNAHMEMLRSTDRYVRLRSGQLVGAALCVYVKNSKLGHISHVEGATKKTGLSGMAGNKGAVAIRMQYAEMGICFVTAHLAAGFANYDERNKDFNTINHGLRFQRNRGIDDHETVIWLGDFNYRIGMSNDRVRNLVKLGDLSTLYENDQLNIQMVAGLTFPHYSESKITFLPTYKFDVGTDTYDTSEKARIPAWTDRILRKGKNIRQTCYQCAELHLSDHKPVYATFEVTVNIIDQEVRNALSHRLFGRRRAEVEGTGPINLSESEDEDLIGFKSIEPGLPPASSDRRKWWLDGGAPARSAIQPLAKGMMPNPNRPSNPWIEADEEEWVQVPRPSLPVDRDVYDSFQTARSDRSLDPAVVTYPKFPKAVTHAAPPPVRKKLPPPYVPVGGDRRPPQRQSTSSSMSSAAEMASRMDSLAVMDPSSPAVPRRKQSDSIVRLPPVTGANLSSLNSTNASLAAPISLTTIPGAVSALMNTTSREETDGTSPTYGSERRKPPPVARKPVNLASKPSPHIKPASLRSPSLGSTKQVSPTSLTFNRLSPGRSQSMRSPRSPANESHGRRTGSTANAATMAALGAFGGIGPNDLSPVQPPIPQGQPGGLFPSPPRRRTAQSVSVGDVEKRDMPTSTLGPAPKIGPKAMMPIEAGMKRPPDDYQKTRESLLDAQRMLQAGGPGLKKEKFGDTLSRDKVPPAVPQPRRGGGSSPRNEVEEKPPLPSRPMPPRPDSKKEQLDLLSNGDEQELKGYGVLRPSG